MILILVLEIKGRGTSMKKGILFLLMIVTSYFLIFAQSKPSMDGRASVAEYGELPVGLFAKSSSYLPGDTVIVTNPSANISIEVMIFGVFDSSEGIAIILSPEAARELYITKGSNNIVQVTKKNSYYYENNIISKKLVNYTPEADPDLNLEMLIDE